MKNADLSDERRREKERRRARLRDKTASRRGGARKAKVQGRGGRR